MKTVSSQILFKLQTLILTTHYRWHIHIDMSAADWSRAQRRAFANDYENLLVVEDSANQSKSDKAPHEWLPPNENFWCEYGERWTRAKDKYGLSYTEQERIALDQLPETCF